ncbi:MAG TPA: hypothetical protein EYO71_11220, partial [Rhodospirillales bacterium]|nr:hypothetical protein [Rhodospirillales bacterium]
MTVESGVEVRLEEDLAIEGQLLIESGVKIVMEAGTAINGSGLIQAEGTDSAPITFSVATTAGSTVVSGSVDLSNMATVTQASLSGLEYHRLIYCQFNGYQIDLDLKLDNYNQYKSGSLGRIQNCQFQNCQLQAEATRFEDSQIQSSVVNLTRVLSFADNQVDSSQISLLVPEDIDNKAISIEGNQVTGGKGLSVSDISRWAYGLSIEISRNQIENVVESGAAGLSVKPHSNPILVEGNTISNCGLGLEIKSNMIIGQNGTGQGLDQLTIRYNNLQSNSQSLQLPATMSSWQSAVPSVAVGYNWWGSVDAAAIGQQILEHQDDIQRARANYSPLLAQAYDGTETSLP